MTLKRITTNVGAPQSTLGRSPEERVNAADLDFGTQIHECVTSSMARAATKVS